MTNHIDQVITQAEADYEQGWEWGYAGVKLAPGTYPDNVMQGYKDGAAEAWAESGGTQTRGER